MPAIPAPLEGRARRIGVMTSGKVTERGLALKAFQDNIVSMPSY